MRTPLRPGNLGAVVALLLSMLCAVQQPLAGPSDNASHSDSAVVPPAAQEQQTIKLRLLVKDSAGNPVGGALVNVWHDYTGPDVRPADYQVLETNVNGLAEIEVRASKTDEVTVEAGKGNLKARVNLKLIGPVMSRVIELKQVTTDLFETDPADLIKVKVRVESEGASPGEKGQPLAGAKVTFGLTELRRSQGEDSTNPEGDVTLSLLGTGYWIEATKEGYLPGRTAVHLNRLQRGKTISAPAIKLKKATGEEEAKVNVTVEVRNADTGVGVGGAAVVLTGKAGITSGIFTGQTNPDGRAEITVRGYGRFDLQVSQQYFETHDGEVRILYGEKEKDVGPIALKEKPKAETGGDAVSVTVLAGDRKNAPIEGAKVLVGTKSTTTGADGKATLSASLGESFVVATASAEGYKSQSATIRVRRGVRYTDASATTTIILQPGEDAPTESTPLRLIVEVRDAATSNPLNCRNVLLRLSGRIIADEDTNSAGEASFELKDQPDAPLSSVRSGLRIDASCPKYKPRYSDINADLLAPSATPRRVTVYLERDWAELSKAVGILEGKVAAWNNDATEAAGKTVSVREQVRQVSLAEERVEGLAREIDSFKAMSVGFSGPGSTPRCPRAAQLKQNIKGYESEAIQKEQELKRRLDEATALVARCASAGEADAIRRSHQAAIRLAGEIGSIEKKAVRDADELATLAKETEAVSSTLREAQDIIRRIGVEERAVEVLVRQIGASLLRGSTLRSGLAGRRDALTAELQLLKRAHGLDGPTAAVPTELRKRLDDVEELLASRNNEVFSGPDATLLDAPTKSAARIRSFREAAEKSLADYKNAACEIMPLDDAVQNIGSAVIGATVELGAAANLSKKAEDCAISGSCQPLLGGVRALLELDDIETAAAKVGEARARGCNVTEAEREVEYFRTVRQAANLLTNSFESCRFQEALNLSQQMPAGVRERPLVAEAIRAVQRGLSAQKRIAQLRESARQAVARTGRLDSARPFVAEAESAAADFPCLRDEAARFEEQYKDEPDVAELPEDADEQVGEPESRKPEPVEEEEDKTTPKDRSDSGGATKASNPSAESCDAKERDVWARISGTWEARYGNVTLSGSCESVKGFWMQGTWGHRVRNDGTDQRGEITGGRVRGGTLTLQFFQPWGDKRKGSDSCYLSSDGKQLDCSYLEKLRR